MPPDLQSGPFDRSGIPPNNYPIRLVTNFQRTDRRSMRYRLPDTDHKMGGLLQRMIA